MSKLGITRVEAARRLGRDHTTILVHIRSARLKWKPPPPEPKKAKPPPLGPIPRPWTDSDDRRLSDLAADCVSIGRAANQMDRAYNTVLRHAKRLGLRFERDREAPSENTHHGRILCLILVMVGGQATLLVVSPSLYLRIFARRKGHWLYRVPTPAYRAWGVICLVVGAGVVLWVLNTTPGKLY